MRPLATILLFSSIVFAADRQWQDGIILDIRAGSSNGAIAAPVGGVLVAGRIPGPIFYYIGTSTKTYVLARCAGCRPLNVTLHGKTQIAIDGRKAHLRDDAGKDVKLPIVEKIE